MTARSHDITELVHFEEQADGSMCIEPRISEDQRIQHAIDHHDLTSDPCPACVELGEVKKTCWLCKGDGFVFGMDTVPCGPDCPLQESRS